MFDQYFWLEITEHIDNKTEDFFSSTNLAFFGAITFYK